MWEQVYLALKKEESVLTDLRELAKKRSQSQPLDKLTCGSVFKNPLPERSGDLIERTGLKGFQIGQAKVSLKHANFIENLGEASSQDIHNLIKHIQESVFKKFQILLEPEVKYLGNWL